MMRELPRMSVEWKDEHGGREMSGVKGWALAKFTKAKPSPPSFLSIGDGGGVGPHLVGVAVLLLGA